MNDPTDSKETISLTEQFTLGHLDFGKEGIESYGPRPNDKPLRNVLTYLTFQGHGLRIGMELSICVVLYSCLQPTLITLIPTARPEALSLFAWFSACFLVALADQVYLIKPLRTYQHICELELLGQYLPALALLERISPNSNCPIPCPRPLYHFRRAQILSHAGCYAESAAELATAYHAGLSTVDYYVGRADILKNQGELVRARTELSLAEQLLGRNPILKLEDAIITYSERKHPAARKKLEEVLALPSVPYTHGETTGAVALGYWEASRLWTGEAEEGLEGLSVAIVNLKIAADYIESLRPVVASLLLERAYYLVTHKEPIAALSDTNLALSLCQHPELKKRSEDVREEHASRYKPV